MFWYILCPKTSINPSTYSCWKSKFHHFENVADIDFLQMSKDALRLKGFLDLESKDAKKAQLYYLQIFIRCLSNILWHLMSWTSIFVCIVRHTSFNHISSCCSFPSLKRSLKVKNVRFLWQITLGIKSVLKFISQGVNDQRIYINYFFFIRITS